MTIEEVKSLVEEVIPDVSIQNYFEWESKEPIKFKGYSERGICILAYHAGYDISLRISLKEEITEFHLDIAGNSVIRRFIDNDKVNIYTYKYFLELITIYKDSMYNLRSFGLKQIPIQIIRDTKLDSLIN